MVQRLLLDWVHGDGGWPAVAKLDKASGFILADVTEAVLAFSNVTVART
jgi:hypothetical protein